jgi:hypothetical protein
MGEIGQENIVPGQKVLPGMAEELGYETIMLKPWLERFCWEYVFRGDNGARAYKAVKPTVKDSTTRVEASKLLTNPDVIGRIAQIKAEQRRRFQVQADDLVEYHGRVLKVDRTTYLDEVFNRPKSIEEIREIDPEALSILEFECQKDKDGSPVVLFKIPRRHESAVEMARIMGLHKDGVNAAKEGAAGLADLLNEISGRHEHRDIVKEKGCGQF